MRTLNPIESERTGAKRRQRFQDASSLATPSDEPWESRAGWSISFGPSVLLQGGLLLPRERPVPDPVGRLPGPSGGPRLESSQRLGLLCKNRQEPSGKRRCRRTGVRNSFGQAAYKTFGSERSRREPTAIWPSSAIPSISPPYFAARSMHPSALRPCLTAS